VFAIAITLVVLDLRVLVLPMMVSFLPFPTRLIARAVHSGDSAPRSCSTVERFSSSRS
jgi:uncharacterized membrane protein